jgi:hypothetical protein
MKKVFLIIFIFLQFVNDCEAQQVPSAEENIPFLVTFGKDGDKSWGDDDFSQSYFFVIPKIQIDPIYIRIFDPETSGEYDEVKGPFNTKTQFSIYGGKTCFTSKDVKYKDPTGNYKSGNLLASKIFTDKKEYDGTWYTFGPFNPTEGEFVNDYNGYVFKIIAEGTSGDDGNLYMYFLSSSPTENKPIEGGNAFTFEYTFRLSDRQTDVAHLYPYIEDNVLSINFANFDFDDDGEINIVSIVKNGDPSKPSSENNWAYTTHKIEAEEKKTTLDVQLIKNKKILVKNNNVTIYITKQNGNLLPLYNAPIGGVPKNSKVQFKERKKIVPY